MIRSVLILAIASITTGCSTLSFDKEKMAEQRKQELCRDIETRDQPQCTGQHTPKP